MAADAALGPGVWSKARYVFREGSLFVIAVSVGIGSAVLMDLVLCKQAAAVMPAPQSSKQMMEFLDTASSLGHIIASYIAVRVAWVVRVTMPMPRDDAAAFDAYEAISILCWANILCSVASLLWTLL